MGYPVEVEVDSMKVKGDPEPDAESNMSFESDHQPGQKLSGMTRENVASSLVAFGVSSYMLSKEYAIPVIGKFIAEEKVELLEQKVRSMETKVSQVVEPKQKNLVSKIDSQIKLCVDYAEEKKKDVTDFAEEKKKDVTDFAEEKKKSVAVFAEEKKKSVAVFADLKKKEALGFAESQLTNARKIPVVERLESATVTKIDSLLDKSEKYLDVAEEEDKKEATFAIKHQQQQDESLGGEEDSTDSFDKEKNKENEFSFRKSRVVKLSTVAVAKFKAAFGAKTESLKLREKIESLLHVDLIEYAKLLDKEKLSETKEALEVKLLQGKDMVKDQAKDLFNSCLQVKAKAETFLKESLFEVRKVWQEEREKAALREESSEETPSLGAAFCAVGVAAKSQLTRLVFGIEKKKKHHQKAD